MTFMGPGAMHIGLHGGVYSQCPKLDVSKHGFQPLDLDLAVGGWELELELRVTTHR